MWEQHAGVLGKAVHWQAHEGRKYEARILSNSRYETRLRAAPRKRVVYEPRSCAFQCRGGGRARGGMGPVFWLRWAVPGAGG